MNIARKSYFRLVHGVPATSREVKFLVSGVQEHCTEGNEPVSLPYVDDKAHVQLWSTKVWPRHCPYLLQRVGFLPYWPTVHTQRCFRTHAERCFFGPSLLGVAQRALESLTYPICLEEKLSTVPPISESHTRDTPRPVPRRNMC